MIENLVREDGIACVKNNLDNQKYIILPGYVSFCISHEQRLDFSGLKGP